MGDYRGSEDVFSLPVEKGPGPIPDYLITDAKVAQEFKKWLFGEIDAVYQQRHREEDSPELTRYNDLLHEMAHGCKATGNVKLSGGTLEEVFTRKGSRNREIQSRVLGVFATELAHLAGDFTVRRLESPWDAQEDGFESPEGKVCDALATMDTNLPLLTQKIDALLGMQRLLGNSKEEVKARVLLLVIKELHMQDEVDSIKDSTQRENMIMESLSSLREYRDDPMTHWLSNYRNMSDSLRDLLKELPQLAGYLRKHASELQTMIADMSDPEPAPFIVLQMAEQLQVGVGHQGGRG